MNRNRVVSVLSFSLVLFAGLVLAGMQDPVVIPPQGLMQVDSVHCSGRDDSILEKRHIENQQDDITVTADGDVIVKDSYLIAGRYGVLVTGNGDVSLSNTFVQGGAAALLIAGNGTLRAKDCTFQGNIQVGGNGDFVDLGGNQFYTARGARSERTAVVSKVTVDRYTGGIRVSTAAGMSISVSLPEIDVDLDDPEVEVDLDESNVDEIDTDQIDGDGRGSENGRNQPHGGPSTL